MKNKRERLDDPRKRTPEEWCRLIPQLEHWAFKKGTRRKSKSETNMQDRSWYELPTLSR
jgi:hypothetical protein